MQTQANDRRHGRRPSWKSPRRRGSCADTDASALLLLWRQTEGEECFRTHVSKPLALTQCVPDNNADFEARFSSANQDSHDNGADSGSQEDEEVGKAETEGVATRQTTVER